MIRVLPAHENEFNSAVELMKTHQGPALCESLLLCYEAGKPFEYEPYSVQDLVRTGRLHEDELLQLLRTHHFQTVQIELRSDEVILKNGSICVRASTPTRRNPIRYEDLPKVYERTSGRLPTLEADVEMAIFCPN